MVARSNDSAGLTWATGHMFPSPALAKAGPGPASNMNIQHGNRSQEATHINSSPTWAKRADPVIRPPEGAEGAEGGPNPEAPNHSGL